MRIHIPGLLGWAFKQAFTAVFFSLSIGVSVAEPIGFKVIDITGPIDSKLLPEFHLFGDQNLTFTLKVKGPADSHAKLGSRLFQASSGLVAPLNELAMSQEFQLNGAGEGTIPFAVHLPKVEKQTSMLLKFVCQMGTTTTPAGVVRIYTYPANLTGELKQLRTPISVFGSSVQLREFLRSNEIQFGDLGEALPEVLDPGYLYLGDAEGTALAGWNPNLRSPGQCGVLVFTADPWRIAGVYEANAGGIRYRKVTLPLLPALGKDPRSQATLVELILQAALHINPQN